jgi:hypothetical protein
MVEQGKEMAGEVLRKSPHLGADLLSRKCNERMTGLRKLSSAGTSSRCSGRFPKPSAFRWRFQRSKRTFLLRREQVTEPSRYSSVYLGIPGEDPTPVFRDTHPEAFEGALAQAVMLVRFRAEDFPHLRPLSWRFPVDEYFGEDGWPVDFPAGERDLNEDVRRSVQVCPTRWRAWTTADWNDARACALTFRVIYNDSLTLRHAHDFFFPGSGAANAALRKT